MNWPIISIERFRFHIAVLIKTFPAFFLSAAPALEIKPAQLRQSGEILLKYAISQPGSSARLPAWAHARARPHHFKEQRLSVGQSAVTRRALQAAPLHRFDSVIPHTAWRGPLNFYLLIKITKLSPLSAQVTIKVDINCQWQRWGGWGWGGLGDIASLPQKFPSLRRIF